jgi:hypothetical protein
VWTFTVDVEVMVPSNPNIVHGEVIRDTTPAFDWEDIPSGSGYQIQVDDEEGFDDPILIDEELLLSGYDVAAPAYFEDGMQYYWRVRVKDSGDAWREWSGTWSFEIQLQVVSYVERPENDGYTSDQTPELEWEEIGSAAEYHVQVSEAEDGFDSPIEEAFTQLPEYEITTALSNGAAYYWRVRIENEDEVLGGWSEVFSFHVYYLGAPVVSGDSPTNSRRPIWDWEPVFLATEYRASFVDGSGWVELGGVTEYTPAVDLNAGDHTLYVQAGNETGSWSPSGSCTIEIDLTPPPVPTVEGTTPTNDTTPTWD